MESKQDGRRADLGRDRGSPAPPYMYCTLVSPSQRINRGMQDQRKVSEFLSKVISYVLGRHTCEHGFLMRVVELPAGSSRGICSKAARGEIEQTNQRDLQACDIAIMTRFFSLMNNNSLSSLLTWTD